jgi:16S rRNA (cytosine1402-N4)-methyltransferase
LQNATENELEKIFREYGEEKNSKKIANLIVEKRKENKIERTQQLVAIVEEINGKHIGKIHPATRVFQALRIAVNDELGVVKKVLPDAIDMLLSGGRLAVITFHSLEDRIVKHYFKSQNGKIVKIITNKPIICSDEESEANPRARSAKLRVVEKI